MNSMIEPESQWIEEFRSQGFEDAALIGVGMEGAVYLLIAGELIAKVWKNAGKTRLERLKAFYEVLKRSAGAIATPQVLEIRYLHGAFVTLEKFLPGNPLETRLPREPAHPDALAVGTLVEVLTFLRTIPPDRAFTDVTVLGEASSPWKGQRKWSDAVQSLLSSRVSRFSSSLQQAVPDLDRILKGAFNFLRTRDSTPLGLIHGDICGSNVMVDESMRLVAVFDFGFLSMLGDSAFDASIAAAVFDMYGPHARAIDEAIIDVFAEQLDYPKRVLLAYQAVYSLLSSNAYSENGDDEHFGWCVAMLHRADVRDALQL